MKLTPIACTVTSTWPGPGSGAVISSSFNASRPPGAWTRMAFTVATSQQSPRCLTLPPAHTGHQLDVGGPRQLALDLGHPLHLAARGEPLVEALGAEQALDVGPGLEPLLPALGAALFGVGILGGEPGADPDHRLERDR